MKKGFISSMDNIKETMINIKDWDSLLKESNEGNITNQEPKEEKPSNGKGKYIFCLICGFIFCLLNFICVQIGLIIINAIFKEIIDELKLALNSIPRKYNFYENIEIVSYKSVPDIDVGMFFSFLGLTTMKKCEFILSYSIFQIMSICCFIVLFLLFDFHSRDELLKNYTKMEVTILIIFYILFCIFIGASSCLSLKEFFKVYKIYYRNNLYEKDENEINDKEEEKNDVFLEKFLFFIFSTLSALSTIGIIRLIFTSIKIKEQKKILYSFLIIYPSIIALSFIFYLYYSLPKFHLNIDNREESMRKEGSQSDIIYGIVRTMNNQSYIYHSSLNNNITYNKLNASINNKGTEDNNKTTNDNVKNNNNNIKRNDVRKACTCFGYVYFQKSIDKKNVCVCYYYSSWYSWFCVKIRKPIIFAPLVAQFFFHCCCVAENSILSERLLNVYSISSNIKYLLILISYVFIIIILFLFNYNLSTNFMKEGNKCQRLIFVIILIFYLLLNTTIFTLILSLRIILKSHLRKDDYDFLIKSDVAAFKSLDLMMLSLYDFLDDEDCLNTSIFIYFERFLWTILEMLFDLYELYMKTLCIFQMIFSIIFFIVLGFSIFFMIRDVKIMSEESNSYFNF